MIEMVTKYDKVIFILAGIGYLFNYFMTSEHIISITVRSSKNEKETQTAALCAITKDSERYIDEWIDYNFALGFHSIYLYDTSHELTMNEWVKKLHSNGRQNLYLHHAKIFQKKGAQSEIYTECAKTHGKIHTYLAFFDDDEFLVLKKHSDVVSMLHDHLPNGSLRINWQIFGTSGHTHYEPIPVTKRFVYRHKETSRRKKSNVKVCDLVSPDVHCHEIKEGTRHYDTDGERKVTCAPRKNRPSDVAVLHHYKYKSEQEFRQKTCERGDFQDSMTKCNEKYLATAFHGDVYDDSAWEFLKSKVPRYQIYDE